MIIIIIFIIKSFRLTDPVDGELTPSIQKKNKKKNELTIGTRHGGGTDTKEYRKTTSDDNRHNSSRWIMTNDNK